MTYMTPVNSIKVPIAFVDFARRRHTSQTPVLKRISRTGGLRLAKPRRKSGDLFQEDRRYSPYLCLFWDLNLNMLMPDMKHIQKAGEVAQVTVTGGHINDDPWLDGRLCQDIYCWSFRVAETLQLQYQSWFDGTHPDARFDLASDLPGNY